MSERFDWHPEPELIDVRDPERARAALEQLGERTWTEALDWLYDHAMQRPTAPDLYPALRAAYYGPSGKPPAAPQQGATSADVLAEFRERLAPYLYAAQHPGSYSYFTPPPLPIAIAAETLAAWTNQGIDLWLAGMAAPFVEEEVTRWLCDLTGYAEGSWGILASGGVMANIMGLTVARDIHLAKLLGLDAPPRGAQLEDARIYVSDQAHFSIARGVDMLGFPEATLRVLPSDDRFRLRAETVAAAVAEDRAAGRTPFCIAPVAGSTNTGSVDPVDELADVAEREGLWLHVDAAYGGAVRLSPRDADRVTGLARADSITIDPHKWFFQPYDIGALLVKRQEDLRNTFHREPEYYRRVGAGGPAAALVPVLVRGHAAVPRAQAVDDVEAPGHRRARAAGRAERRPRRASRRTPRPGGLGRDRSRSSPWCASVTSLPCSTVSIPWSSTRIRRACSGRSRSAARDGSPRRRSAGGRTCAPGS